MCGEDLHVTSDEDDTPSLGVSCKLSIQKWPACRVDESDGPEPFVTLSMRFQASCTERGLGAMTPSANAVCESSSQQD